MTGSLRVAFFDVDETLITAKSMFDFLRHWLEVNGDDGSRFRRAAAQLRDLSARGVPREVANRVYYRNYAGADGADVAAAGRDWYAGYRRRPDAFVAPSVAALARHRAAGDTVALVSGSFPPCLDPLADDLGADLVLCAELVVDADGRYTGEINVPMIGRAKADAVGRTIRALGADPARCHAYGDHVSDLDMLRAVGHPTVVGADRDLGRYAQQRGWPVLSPAGQESQEKELR